MVLQWRMNCMFLLLILVLSSLTYLHSDNINHNISIKAKNVSQKLGLYEKKADLYQRMEEFNKQSIYFLNLDDNTIIQFNDCIVVQIKEIKALLIEFFDTLI